ncbi:MAG TPA: isoprenylcysteine carboxylmethyltransferase family protein [Lacunisphaera sp.]|nr:isoprenylcysteine carboxylmethyltransferase family protein [Lacunisphaera sp.]
MKTFLLTLRSLVYGGAFLALFAGWLPLRFFARHAQWPAAWAAPQFGGAVLVALGAITMLACVWIFISRGRGTPAPFDPPVKFVRRGLYKWVRNPMYLGLLAFVGGEGLFLRSGDIGVYWVCLVCSLHLLVVLYEENALRRQFGAMYEDYKRDVSRWLPRKPKPMLQTVAPFEHRR